MKINTGLDNKRVALNILFNTIAQIINAFIGFFITPYITSRLGADAYGFVKLSNDFTSYGYILTLALNSMASRFIMLKKEQDDEKAARSYYSSITIANIILSLILVIPAIITVIKINYIFNVPEHLLASVRWTFVWNLSNFIICLAGTTFGNCFFLKNRLDISSILTSITSILRAVFILAVFIITGPSISVLAFGNIVVTAIFLPCNIYFHRRLTPELYFDRNSFDFRKVTEVVSSGVWNSITRLSNILTTGLDLTVSNIMLGALEMGYLSIAKTIPNFIGSLIDAVGNSFTPNLMQIYVSNNKEQLKMAIKSSMRTMTVFSSIPLAILISFGVSFYQLWVPNQPSELLNILSVLTAIGLCISGPMQPIYQLFTITNRVKQSSIVIIIRGFLSIGLTLFCVKFLGLGLYAVAGVSVILSILTSLFYHLPMGAIYVEFPWYTFVPEVFKSIILLSVQSLIGFLLIQSGIWGHSWIMWFTGAGVSGILGLIIAILAILNKEERNTLLSMMYNKTIGKILRKSRKQQ